MDPLSDLLDGALSMVETRFWNNTCKMIQAIWNLVCRKYPILRAVARSSIHSLLHAHSPVCEAAFHWEMAHALVHGIADSGSQ